MMKSPESVLELQIKYLQEAHEENKKEIRELKVEFTEYKSKTERYGWFAMGIIAVGIYAASSFDQILKIGKLIRGVQ